MVILKRRGIYEIAIKAGVPILCSYTFGTTKAFSASWGGKNSLLPKLSRMARTSLFIFWGRFGLPVPRRVAITTVMGVPIHTRPSAADDPTTMDAEIQRLQSLVLETYQEIFDKHKVAYGWKHKKLIFK